jgi:REP element-mobilizing transposase RayT
MRGPRIKARSDSPVGHYHCVSRVVDRTFRFGDQEKEFFRKLFRLYEDFCGIRVLSYCVMSNHFHLLLEVPKRPDVLPDDNFLLEKVGKIYSRGEVASIRRELALRAHNPELLAAYREQFFRRMWDLSNFMKLVKQRFSIWFNRLHQRHGTLWEERFSSVLIESEGRALGAIAAYIDLNPVRARIVEDPKDYRWCSYAESVAGNRSQTEALVRTLPPGHQDLAEYRKLIYAIGVQRGVSGGDYQARPGFTREQVQKVWDSGGELPLAEVLGCRVRYFVHGLVLGSREFVNEVFARYRAKDRTDAAEGAKPLEGIEAPELFTLRGVRRSKTSAGPPSADFSTVPL